MGLTIGHGIGIPFKKSGISWQTYWTHQSEVLFFGLYSEIADGKMPNKVTGATDYLTVTGSAGSEVYATPNTAAYKNADTDYCWWKTDASQSTTTTARLIGYDFARTIVYYGNTSPYSIVAILILNSALSTAKMNKLRDDFDLSIWWDNISSNYGNTKGNRSGEQSIWIPESTATITTTSITANLLTTASSGGNVTSDGGGTVTARGVCWSTSPNPTTADSKTTDGSGTGIFTSSLTGLTKGTTYHVRAYATNEAGTVYGADIQFQTMILYDTFTDNYVRLNTHTSEDGGTWVEQNGVWRCDGTGKVLEYSSGASYFATKDAGKVSNTISVNITTPSSGTAVYAIGLTFRYGTTSANWTLYALWDNATTHKIVLQRAATNIASATVTLNTNTTYKLSVVDTGTHIEGYLDGVSLNFNITDSTYNTNTLVGLMQYQNVAYFSYPEDDFITY